MVDKEPSNKTLHDDGSTEDQQQTSLAEASEFDKIIREPDVTDISEPNIEDKTVPFAETTDERQLPNDQIAERINKLCITNDDDDDSYPRDCERLIADLTELALSDETHNHDYIHQHRVKLTMDNKNRLDADTEEEDEYHPGDDDSESEAEEDEIGKDLLQHVEYDLIHAEDVELDNDAYWTLREDTLKVVFSTSKLNKAKEAMQSKRDAKKNSWLAGLVFNI